MSLVDPETPPSPFRAFMRKMAPALRIAALALFALAIWRACAGFDWSAAARPSPVILALLLGAILLNFALSALLVLWITRTFQPHPDVSYPLIARLLFASSLLNYAGYFIPIGLVFRAGYLKSAHNISLTDSAKTAVLMLALSGFVCLTLVAAFLLPFGYILALAALTVASCLAKTAWSRFSVEPAAGHPWLWPALRLCEFALQGARIWLSYKAIGIEIAPTQALFIGAVAVLVGLASGMPSGLGVREWAVGLSGNWLTSTSSEAGLAAGLVDRACEVLIYLVLGGLSLFSFRQTKTAP